MNNNDQKRWTRAGVAFSVFWVVLLTLAILSPPLQANPGAANTDVEPDVLLVMPNNSADKDEVAGALQEMHGTVLRTFGTGAMTTLVVQTERGKLEEVEKKLAKDTAHFSKLQRNMRAYVQGDPVRLNDPYAASLWHIAALSLQEAWSTNKGNGTFIAIADTGCQGTNADLVGRTCDGLDYVSSSTTKNTGNKDDDPESHGTKMATIAMAAANNSKLTAGVSASYLFPIKICKQMGNGMGTTDDNLVNAIWECGSKKIRIRIDRHAQPGREFCQCQGTPRAT